MTPEVAQKGRALGAQAAREQANAAYTDLYPILLEKRAAGETLQAIADWLNGEGYVTRYGKRWMPMTVKLVLERAERLAQ